VNAPLPQGLDPEVRRSLEELFADIGARSVSESAPAHFMGSSMADWAARDSGRDAAASAPGAGAPKKTTSRSPSGRPSPSPSALEARLGCHRAEALGLALLAAARSAMSRSQWSLQPRFSVRTDSAHARRVLRVQHQALLQGERVGSASAPEDCQPAEVRALRLLAALEELQDPTPPSIRQALDLAERLTPSTEGVWLRAGLDKWVSDHRVAAGMAWGRARAARPGSGPMLSHATSRAASPSVIPSGSRAASKAASHARTHASTGTPGAAEAQHLRTRALESYERLSALPLPARQRAGALAAAADLRVRHMGFQGLPQARAAVELEPDWSFPHLVRLHCALCASSRRDAEESLQALQSCLDAGGASTPDSMTELLRRTRLHRELPTWALELHPAFTDIHGPYGEA
jgi:hypothetical protein